MSDPTLHTERLVIRRPVPADAAEVAGYHTRNRPFMAPYSPIRPDDRYTAEYWADRLEMELKGPNLRLFMARREHPERFIGGIDLSAVTGEPCYDCNLGYQMDEEEQGKGYMTEALRAVIPYAFETMHLHRIHAGYMPHNVRSGAVLRKLGFAVEGFGRDHVRIAGRWEDHILTALINPAWREPATALWMGESRSTRR